MSDALRVQELEAENARLRRQNGMRRGIMESHYSAAQLAVLWGTAERFWLDRIKDGRLGVIGEPGGPINLNPGSPRGDWRIPGSAVWRYLMEEPVLDSDEAERPLFARNQGELRRSAAA